MQSIIVVSHAEDQHAQRVLDRARQMGVSAILWDVSEYPKNAEVSLPLYGSILPKILINGKEVGDVLGVFWRRPNGRYRSSVTNKMDEYMLHEGRVVISALSDYFPKANWISKPWAEIKGGNKAYQLNLARRMGLKIPLTCITNKPDEVKRFIDHLGGKPLTMKPTGTAFINLSDSKDLSSSENKVVFTKIVDSSEVLANLDMVKNCPVIFQEAINKESDFRLTVVDDLVHVAKITLEGCSDPTNLDWKNWEGVRKYVTSDVSDTVREQCVDIVKALGLRFGCVDLGFSSKDGYTFFEVNPQGQWLPSEEKLCYDISGSIVRALIK